MADISLKLGAKHYETQVVKKYESHEISESFQFADILNA